MALVIIAMAGSLQLKYVVFQENANYAVSMYIIGSVYTNYHVFGFDMKILLSLNARGHFHRYICNAK